MGKNNNKVLDSLVQAIPEVSPNVFWLTSKCLSNSQKPTIRYVIVIKSL